MRRLADELVAQYGQMEADEISRHQYKASHTLDGDPRVTWSYEPFSESLYIDLEQDVEEKDDVEGEGYPRSVSASRPASTTIASSVCS